MTPLERTNDILLLEAQLGGKAYYSAFTSREEAIEKGLESFGDDDEKVMILDIPDGDNNSFFTLVAPYSTENIERYNDWRLLCWIPSGLVTVDSEGFLCDKIYFLENGLSYGTI